MPAQDGLRHKKAFVLKLSCHGFTFMEIMVTLIIVSVGIVAIYKAFFSSLDHMSRLKTRLYADIAIDNHIAILERTLRAYKVLPVGLELDSENSDDVKEIKFNPQVEIGEVQGFIDTFQVDVAYQWEENNRLIRINRSAYISDFVTDEKIP